MTDGSSVCPQLRLLRIGSNGSRSSNHRRIAFPLRRRPERGHWHLIWVAMPEATETWIDVLSISV